LGETQVDLPWSHKIALRIPAYGKGVLFYVIFYRTGWMSSNCLGLFSVRYASLDCNMILCNCNGYCAYANGFIALAEDLGEDIKRAYLHVLFVEAGEHYVRIDV